MNVAKIAANIAEQDPFCLKTHYFMRKLTSSEITDLVAAVVAITGFAPKIGFISSLDESAHMQFEKLLK